MSTHDQRIAQIPFASVYLITGVICGYRVEEIRDPLTQLEKILRGTRA